MENRHKNEMAALTRTNEQIKNDKAKLERSLIEVLQCRSIFYKFINYKK